MNVTHKIKGTAENWESGELGLDTKHAQRVSEEEAAAVEKATGLNMQLISIRMPADLLRVLKEIAKYRGIGYQPMIRDLLDRWAVGEIKTILNERLEDAKKRESEQQASTPLVGDLRHTA
ncbi:hypothetical protein RHOFW104T7_01290 [Rhodanobacter thiooxydans]|uniref:CopG family transcriptional regulator n=1 Tax=Rhodanobacter thiooxydans TaxID=416169 RepID=A0A154QDN6_9GAMM|nr:hypothetical protein UUA_17155 [Rhodanobacter thiooxydans LCS2]KZC22333.1 hypothetical protein RHOFW104T7_01290 [Rhodanobacter thiooxydans]